MEEKIHLASTFYERHARYNADGLIFAKAWEAKIQGDVLILREAVSVDDLPKGAVIGTGSKRRKYQLLKIRLILT